MPGVLSRERRVRGSLFQFVLKIKKFIIKTKGVYPPVHPVFRFSFQPERRNLFYKFIDAVRYLNECNVFFKECTLWDQIGTAILPVPRVVKIIIPPPACSLRAARAFRPVLEGPRRRRPVQKYPFVE